MSYILPQVQVFQLFANVPTTTVANLNAFVFGPNYQLFRYSVAAEKALVGLGAYAKDADTVYSYPSQPAGSVVDLSYVKLYMENVWAEYLSIASGAANPLVSVSLAARNKLRAAPVIGDIVESADSGTSIANGVPMDSGGYFVGGVSLPENYYFWPVGGAASDNDWDSDEWQADLGDGDDARLTYSTSEGLTGNVDVLATNNPLTSGTWTEGPDGIQLDLDVGTRTAVAFGYTIANPADGDLVTISDAAGSVVRVFEFDIAAVAAVGDVAVTLGADALASFDALRAAILTDTATMAFVDDVTNLYTGGFPAGTFTVIGDENFTVQVFANPAATASAYNTLRKPAVLTFSGVTTSFALSLAADYMRTIVDWAVDDGLPVKVNITAAGAQSVSYSSVTKVLTIVLGIGGTPYTTRELYDALAADSDIATVFDLDARPAAGVDVTAVVDETGASQAVAANLTLLRDAYRMRITPNPYTFKTGNGTSRSTHLKSRDVQVGDRIRYSVTDDSLVTHTGTSRIVALEADQSLASIADPTSKTENSATQAATTLTPKAGADVVTAGTDNQRDFDGAQTKVFALSPTYPTYTGELSTGYVSDTYTVTVTATGAAGTAQATVANDSGTYSRTAVSIETDPAGDATRARIYLGRNLWLMFDQGTSDADAEFQAGDTYTFSTDIDATFAAASASTMASSGVYTGLGDTLYVLEVTRGGVFDRAVNAIDGLQNPCQMVITYTGQPLAADIVTVGSTDFVADTDFTIAGTADLTYANLAAAINAAPIAAYAALDATANTVTVTGPGSLINGSLLGADLTDLTDYTNATEVVDAVQLVPVMDWDNWTGGDVDDEYILRCSTAGSIATAQFQLLSQQGDAATAIQFTGWGTGTGDALAVGARGLSLYFQDLEGTSPTFTVGDYWVVKANASRPQIQVTDTAGLDNTSLVVPNDGVAFDVGGYGVDMTFSANANTEAGFCANGGLRKGDVYYVAATAAADGAYKVLVLADDIPPAVTEGLDASGDSEPEPNNFSIWLYLVQSSTQVVSKRTWSPPDRNWLAASTGITVYEDIAVQDSTWYEGDGTQPWLPVYSGDMYVEYRALLTTYSDTIHFISDIAEVATTLGTVTPDNPLSQGVYNALSNSGDRGVYYMAVATDDSTGYSGVLDAASLSDDVYGFVPVTRTAAILNLVEAHINAMSTETNKRWRIGFVGTSMASEGAVYNRANNPGSEPYYAVVEDDPAVPGSQYTVVKFVDSDGDPSAYTSALTDIIAGDKVRLSYSTDAWGDATYVEYSVASVLSNTTIKLTAGPAAPNAVPSKVEVWHDYTVAEMAVNVAATSANFANRRMYHVFPNELGAYGVTHTAEFGAAAVAGLMSSVPPQQGITNIELNGFNDIPQVYSTFNSSQLNAMAESGTLIIMQELAGGRVYIRHQVSSAAADGNLNTTELSVTKNLDSISYYFAGRLEYYIGRYNITPKLLEILATQIDHGLHYLGSMTDLGLIGPQIILGPNTKLVSIQQHASLQDHVIAVVNIQMPYPLNVLQFKIVV